VAFLPLKRHRACLKTYDELLSDNLRWYSNIRFAQLTLYLAITAAIYNGLVTDNLSILIVHSIALKIGGIFSSALFWYLEMRADEYWSHFMKRAVVLEKELKFKQYTERPQRRFRTTVAIRLFIAGVGIIWIVSLFLNL
jgi:hypothetical protein